MLPSRPEKANLRLPLFLVVVLVIATVVAGCARRELVPAAVDTPTPVATPTPAATLAPTTEPTAAPASTFTPTPDPTNTREPTPAPMSTATPRPTLIPTATHPPPAATPTLEPPASTPPTTQTPTAVPPRTGVPEAGSTALTEVFTNESYGYSIAYPEGWIVEGEGDFIQILHTFGSNVSIAAAPTEGLPIDRLVDLIVGGASLELDDFEERSRTKIDEPAGYLIEADAAIDELKVVFKLLVTINGDNSISAASFVADFFEEFHQPILDKMLASLRTFPVSESETGPAAAMPGVDTPVGPMAAYESARYPFSIQYPAYWESQPITALEQASGTRIKVAGTGGGVLVIGEEDLVAFGLGTMSLDEYVDLTLNVVSSLTPGFELESRKSISTEQGLSAAIVVFTAGGGVFKGTRLIYLHDERFGFGAVYIAPSAVFAELEPLFEHSFGTFRVTVLIEEDKPSTGDGTREPL